MQATRALEETRSKSPKRCEDALRLCFGWIERRFLKEGRQIIYSSLAQLERFRCRCRWQMQATRALEETRSKSPKRCEDALRLCFGWIERRFLKEGRQIIYSSLAQLERFRCRCRWQMQATRALEETRSKSPKRCEDALRLCFGWVERRFLKEGRQNYIFLLSSVGRAHDC